MRQTHRMLEQLCMRPVIRTMDTQRWKMAQSAETEYWVQREAVLPGLKMGISYKADQIIQCCNRYRPLKDTSYVVQIGGACYSEIDEMDSGGDSP